MWPAKQAQLANTTHHDHVGYVHREGPVHLAALWHIGDAYVPSRVISVDLYLSLGRVQHPGDDLKEGALARPIGAYHGNPLASGELKRYVVQGAHAVITHCDAGYVQRRRAWLVGSISADQGCHMVSSLPLA